MAQFEFVKKAQPHFLSADAVRAGLNKAQSGSQGEACMLLPEVLSPPPHAFPQHGRWCRRDPQSRLLNAMDSYRSRCMPLSGQQDTLWFALFREGTRLAPLGVNDFLRLRGTCRAACDQLDHSTFWERRYEHFCGAQAPLGSCKKAFLVMRQRQAEVDARRLARGVGVNAVHAVSKSLAASAIGLMSPFMMAVHLPVAPLQGALVGAYAAAFVPVWAAIASYICLGEERPVLRSLSTGALVLSAPMTSLCCATLGAAAGAGGMIMTGLFMPPLMVTALAGHSVMSAAKCASEAYRLAGNASVLHRLRDICRW